MRSIDFGLKRYLETHSLSAYRLAEASKGRLSRGTVYALARGGVSRIDLHTLSTVMTVLEELTGLEVQPNDLLVSVTLPEPDPEAQEWEGAELMPDLLPYAWGDAGEPSGERVRHVPGIGFVAGKA